MMKGNNGHNGWITFFLVVAAIALLCDFVWCMSLMLGESVKFVVFMISAFSVLILIPVFILDFAGLITSFFTKDSRRNLLMGLSGAGIALFALSGFLLVKGGVDAEKLEKNYLIKSSDIEQTIDYTLSSLEDGRGLDIEFDGRGSVSIFQVFKDGDWGTTFNPSKDKVDSLAAEIGLTPEILNEMRNRLYNAKCHSINIIKKDGSYDVATLMFRRDLGSAYYYEIHNVAMTPAEMEAVNADDCTRIAFDPHVCFVYGSPAFGDIAFPGKQKYLEKRWGSCQEVQKCPHLL